MPTTWRANLQRLRSSIIESVLLKLPSVKSGCKLRKRGPGGLEEQLAKRITIVSFRSVTRKLRGGRPTLQNEHARTRTLASTEGGVASREAKLLSLLIKAGATYFLWPQERDGSARSVKPGQGTSESWRPHDATRPLSKHGRTTARIEARSLMVRQWSTLAGGRVSELEGNTAQSLRERLSGVLRAAASLKPGPVA